MTQEVQQEQTIDLKLTITQLNTVMAALDELPHKHSRRLFDEIMRQAGAQVQPQQPQGPMSDKLQ